MEEDVMEFDLAVPQQADRPTGGRAALGTMAGLSFAALAAAVWSRLEHESWNFNETTSRNARIGIATTMLGAASIGAFATARKGTGMAAFIGAALGVAVSQVPLILDTELVAKRPVLGNLWQFGIPVATTVLAVNALPKI